MNAVIKHLHVHSGESLEDFTPEYVDRFWITLDICIGPIDQEGYHDFSVAVATPSALDDRIQDSSAIWGRHFLFVQIYDASAIRELVLEKLEECRRPSFEETVSCLSRFFLWEYEDYKVL